MRQAYANQLVDHHLVLDLLPALARAFFARRLPASLSFGQAAILAALGLQQRGLDDVGAALGLPANQVLALFNKARTQGQDFIYSFLAGHPASCLKRPCTSCMDTCARRAWRIPRLYLVPQNLC